jgi:hypothetical protein
VALDLAAVMVSAGVGAAAGYLAGRTGKWQDDGKRRRAVATLLLLELRSLDNQLRQLEKATDPGFVLMDPLVNIFDAFQADLVLFDTQAMASALLLRGLVHDIELYLSRAREPAAGEGEQRRRNFQVQVKARLSLQSVIQVREALLRNGAEDDWRREPLRRFKWPDLPELPPSPFRDEE